MSTVAFDNDSSSLKSIEWVRQLVVKVLNDTFDPVEVARGAALAKLEGGGKKKSKKKKKPNAESETKEEVPPPMSEEEKERIVQEAVAQAKKEFDITDVMVTPATKEEFGDYQCNAAMGLARNLGMSPRDCATQIIEGMRPFLSDIMDEPEIAGPGFINLRFKESYLANAIQKMAQDTEGRLAVPLTTYVHYIYYTTLRYTTSFVLLPFCIHHFHVVSFPSVHLDTEELTLFDMLLCVNTT
jgi:hypothetical protein